MPYYKNSEDEILDGLIERARREFSVGIIDSNLWNKAKKEKSFFKFMESYNQKNTYYRLRANELAHKNSYVRMTNDKWKNRATGKVITNSWDELWHEMHRDIKIDDITLDGEAYRAGDWFGGVNYEGKPTWGRITDIYGNKSIHSETYNDFDNILSRYPYKLPDKYIDSNK